MTTTQSTSWNTFNDRIDPHALISILPIHRSQRVAVVGASPDGLSIPIAKYVYDGSVVAFDQDEERLDALADEAERLRLTNVSKSHYAKSEPLGEVGSFAGAALSDVLHTTTSPKSLFTNTAKLINPGGWLLVVDWLPYDDVADDGPAKSYRIDPEKTVRWAAECNMTPITKRVLGLSRYVQVYRKQR